MSDEDVDGFVVAVPADKKDAYREMPLRLRHCLKSLARFVLSNAGQRCTGWQSDRFSYGGESGRDEEVVFSWIEYPSKEVRDAAIKR